MAARLAALLASLYLVGCATVPPAEQIGGETLSGRMAVKIDASAETPARSENAAFELQGDARLGRMKLSTPLGSQLAEARWSPQIVTLSTPQGSREYLDLDSLTKDVLGESVPVVALFDWLQGRPWPGARSTPTGKGFEQLGWQIDRGRFTEGLITATRIAPPVVTVRAKIER